MLNKLRKINKIKITKSGRINIEYKQYNTNADTWDEYTLTCADAPRPELIKALQNLDKHVIDICELPINYKDRILVTGVSFSYGGENETMGAVIISQMKLEHSNCNLNLNTTHKISESYTPDQQIDPKHLLSDECVRDLYKLIEEVNLYIDGERAQIRLFSIV